jgi:hypothetical protein
MADPFRISHGAGLSGWRRTRPAGSRCRRRPPWPRALRPRCGPAHWRTACRCGHTRPGRRCGQHRARRRPVFDQAKINLDPKRTPQHARIESLDHDLFGGLAATVPRCSRRLLLAGGRHGGQEFVSDQLTQPGSLFHDRNGRQFVARRRSVVARAIERLKAASGQAEASPAAPQSSGSSCS